MNGRLEDSSAMIQRLRTEVGRLEKARPPVLLIYPDRGSAPPPGVARCRRATLGRMIRRNLNPNGGCISGRRN